MNKKDIETELMEQSRIIGIAIERELQLLARIEKLERQQLKNEAEINYLKGYTKGIVNGHV